MAILQGKYVNATIEEVEDGTLGICLKCGEMAFGIEPDTHDALCTHCGEHQVFGLEELHVISRLVIDYDDDYD